VSLALNRYSKGPAVHVFRTPHHSAAPDCGLSYSAAQRIRIRLINRFLSWIVYVILFFMGISLAFLDNLATNLLSILHYSVVTVVVILLCNIAALLWLERTIPWKNHHHQEKLPSRIAMALESLKLCGVVVLGFLLGLTGWAFLQHATEASEYTLIFLLFLIGIQLRNNGMTLKQIVLTVGE
jgi:uncharacterized membrane protein YbjE (DUF340 family)